MNIATTLRRKLEKADRPQSAIARDAGISRFALHHFKTGRSSLSLDRASQLAKVLGLQLTSKG